MFVDQLLILVDIYTKLLGDYFFIAVTITMTGEKHDLIVVICQGR